MSTEWSWEHGNDGASDEDTRTSYAALISKGSTHSFSHHVWNDIVLLTYNLRTEFELPWISTYGSFEDTLMSANEALSARKYNSVLVNIIDTGWPWAYNVEREDYLGRATMRRNDKVFASYILELPKKYNLMIEILNDTAGVPLFSTPGTEIQVLSALNAILSDSVFLSSEVSSEISDSTDAQVLQFFPTPLLHEGESVVETSLSSAMEPLYPSALISENPTVVLVSPRHRIALVAVPALSLSGEHSLSSESWFTEGGNAVAVDQRITPMRSGITSTFYFNSRSARDRLMGSLRQSSMIASSFFAAVVFTHTYHLFPTVLSSVLSSHFAFTLQGRTFSVGLSFIPARSDISSVYDVSLRRLFSHNLGRMRERGEIHEGDSQIRISKSRDLLVYGLISSSEITSESNADLSTLVPTLIGSLRDTAHIYSFGAASFETFEPLNLGKSEGSADIAVVSYLENSAQRTTPIQLVEDYPVILSQHAIRMSVDVGMYLDDEIVLQTENHLLLVDGSWQYPIQTEDDLYIRQAHTLTQTGANLSLA